MNLYLISQSVNRGYDTYDSAVVLASSEDEARNMHPNGGDVQPHTGYYDDTWCEDAASVTVNLLGVAQPELGNEKRVICASFNAG